MMLRTKLPASVHMTTTVFGLPRSGNQQWADFVDDTVSRQHYHPRNAKYQLGYGYRSDKRLHMSQIIETLYRSSHPNHWVSNNLRMKFISYPGMLLSPVRGRRTR